LRILWVKVGGLWPLETGGRLRSFHLVSELSRRHSVVLLTTHAAADDAGALARRLPRAEVVSFPFDIPKRSTAAFARTLLRSWLSPLPVDLLKFQVPALAREVRRRALSGGADLCVADFLSATVNVPLDGPLPVLFFAHNVEHLIWRRLGSIERRPWIRLPLAIEWRKMRRAESRACARADLTVAVSEADAALLAAGSVGAPVSAVPTGVDATYFTPGGEEAPRPSLVFTGSMDWYPNEDAILHFLDEILPVVRTYVPDVSFSVVGRNPTARLRAAAAAAGARVTGTVPDVRPYLSEGMVYVVPLRIGGGTRLKIFEALAAGKAVVSTTVGAEGLPLVPGVHFLQVDDPKEFARAIVSLLRDPGRRAALGAAGRRLVEDRFGWPRVAEDFEARCAEAVRRARAGRTAGRSAGRTPILRRGRRWLPLGILTLARAHRTLDARQIRIYWSLRFRRALGLRTAPGEPPRAVHSVVYICRGNIIRSPMAEALLKRCLDDRGGRAVEVASAGLYARKGQPADPRARIAARHFGIDLESHRARPVSRALLERAALIVPMDSLIEAELRGRHPDFSDKIRLFHSEDGGRAPRPIDIPDPYDGDVAEIRRRYDLIEACVRRQAEELLARRPDEREVEIRRAR